MSVCDCGHLSVSVCFCRVRLGHGFKVMVMVFWLSMPSCTSVRAKEDAMISHGDQQLCELRRNRDVL